MRYEETVQWTVDGPGSVHALELAAAGFTTELAATLLLRMAGNIV